MKLTPEERAVLRKLGKQSRRETAKRFGNGDIRKGEAKLVAIAQAQGKHGKDGGRPAKYPPCKTNGKKNPRHRFWHGRCSLCGIRQDLD